MLKHERHAAILERLRRDGRVMAAELQGELGVSGFTIRRDLDELAADGRLQRVHGGALPRSPVPDSFAARAREEVPGKRAVAAAALTLLEPGQVVALDGGSTALALAQAIAPQHRGTFVTHSPTVAAALGAHGGLDVLVLGGALDPEAMVCVGASVVDAYRELAADLCFLGLWALHAEQGITGRYHEEAEVRRAMLGCADRVVGLASRDKLGTVAPFRSGPATALTDLAVELDTPDTVLAPLRELGIRTVAAPAAR
ncbi:MAG TPA: DeoR/GlpR family DNA-binding transcription regulator [Capillimicrobium sp.]